ncbi:hypothetical protein PBRA_008657 [Plasmodiophora brassicae]|uniref:Glycoside-hydrolase family GH114 TIM-barrel domain-containing protein n=1 Tax=Plasmodiophora brassicae TaxID=37360 RepID=A0A0G4J2E5_PLABS|nr:hypothetical protein PBRA_008657 [Plasmodiophora brassicae]
MGIPSILALAASVLYAMSGVDATWTRPQIGMGWQWELSFTTVPNVTAPNVPVWDLDPDLLTGSDVTTLMDALHANNRYIICYVNVGSLETNRSDANLFTAVTPTIIGNQYPGWPNEKFLDTRRAETRSLMKARFERMASIGCHAIEPDNLDTYGETTGFPLTESDAIAYLNWISTTVHALGMAVGLKNCGDLVQPYNLASLFDFAIVESCAEYSGDCALYNPFIQAGKPVFASEYTDKGDGGCPVIKSVATACAATNAANFEGIVKACHLGPEYHACQTGAFRICGASVSNAFAGGTNAASIADPSTNGRSDCIAGTSIILANPAPDTHASADKLLADTTSDTQSNARQQANTASDANSCARELPNTTANGAFANIRSSGDTFANGAPPVANDVVVESPVRDDEPAAAGVIIGVIVTLVAGLVWTRRRDARAKEAVHGTGQLAAV